MRDNKTQERRGVYSISPTVWHYLATAAAVLRPCWPGPGLIRVRDPLLSGGLSRQL